MHISVCICTCKRPSSLHSLLSAIYGQKFSYAQELKIELVIVDNDIEQSAKPVAHSFEDNDLFSIRYVVESRRGIPIARNTAIKSIAHDSVYIVFIDDDEIPEPSWLTELVKIQRLYQSEIVAGPVLPLFDAKVPQWTINGNFFERPEYKTGELISVAATNNALIDVHWFQTRNIWFDESLALTGGSDSFFFTYARKAGATIVWANDAVVREYIPASRATTRWLLARTFRKSLNLVRFELTFTPTVKVILFRIIKAITRITLGLALLVFSPIRGRVGIVKVLQIIAKGLGNLAGLLNFEYEEYKHIHGS